MAQGRPDGWSVSPVRQQRFDLTLVQGAEGQGMKSPCDAKGDDCVPAPGQPGRAAVLVAVAGPKGESPQSLH
eukprot:3211556-Alexandrium_andersonii.AAC.1